jgi:exodeoxyribonuclease-3
MRPAAGSCSAATNVARTDRDVTRRSVSPASSGQKPEERALIENVCGRGVVDVGRALSRTTKLFTWWAPWPHEGAEHRLAPRLVLASTPLAERATTCVVQREFGTSDHGPVIERSGSGSRHTRRMRPEYR